MSKKIIASVAVIAIIFIGFRSWQATTHDEVTISPEAEPSSLRQLVEGQVIGYNDQHSTHAWRGIAFAQAPVGNKRWQQPQPPKPWLGVQEALNPAPVCPQLWREYLNVPGQDGDVVGQEDCLHLNLWAPKMTAAEAATRKLPVMLWIHGGGNTTGTANQYFGRHLAGSQNVILVAINYRLGMLGWFYHNSLSSLATNPIDASGNYGTLDQIEALRWVQRNIASFGGDPNNVTIFGESAGGRNVYSLIASPLAKGLFHKAISQSGSVRTDRLTEAQNFNDDEQPGLGLSSSEVAAKLLLHDGSASDRNAAKQLLAAMNPQQLNTYLRSKSTEDIINTAKPNTSGMYRSPQIFRDGHVIPREPLLQVFTDTSQYNAVPLITGTNRDEQKLFFIGNKELVDTWFGVLPIIHDIPLYNRLSEYFSDNWKSLAVDMPTKAMSETQQQPIFTYRFDWDESPSNWLVDFPTLIGAAHAVELAFVFGEFNEGVNIDQLYSDENKTGRLALSAQMMNYWGQFAHTGNPGTGSNQQQAAWQPWSPDNDNMLVFDTDADGGIRMEFADMTPAKVKQRIANDSLIDQVMRCRLYKELYWKSYQTTDFGSEAEYLDFGDGCREYESTLNTKSAKQIGAK